MLKKIKWILLLYLLVFLALSIYAFWDFSLLLGWIFAMLSIGGGLFLKNKLIIYLFLKKVKKSIDFKRKDKAKIIFVYFLFNLIFIGFQVLIVICILLFNLKFNDNKKLPDIGIYPINIISFMIGVLMFMPFIIIKTLNKKF
ncbi:hypothetical protein [Mesomycoplasma neurolyticum]|uniref:Uncharacterized protein n=1 Tax=Mesomycoplasma neurolyticum TaxID=2120 RepID=A0A449A506_9BACT|nr:hypothetical protein [Mesomycoplasma neurolyticum]VEU59243.1 Uncharacterised protein [Mesomycoplasma neurolyticum]